MNYINKEPKGEDNAWENAYPLDKKLDACAAHLVASPERVQHEVEDRREAHDARVVQIHAMRHRVHMVCSRFDSSRLSNRVQKVDAEIKCQSSDCWIWIIENTVRVCTNVLYLLVRP